MTGWACIIDAVELHWITAAMLIYHIRYSRSPPKPGLRVRMAVATGTTDLVQLHKVSGSDHQYIGFFLLHKASWGSSIMRSLEVAHFTEVGFPLPPLQVTGRIEYFGQVTRRAQAVSELPSGAQVCQPGSRSRLYYFPCLVLLL